MMLLMWLRLDTSDHGQRQHGNETSSLYYALHT
jgi:hypothetical protein